MKETYESGKPVGLREARAELERREYLAGFCLACYEVEEGGWDAGEMAEAMVEVTAQSRFTEGRLAGIRAAMGR